MAETMSPGGGLYVVWGELWLLMAAMRRGARWSSHSHQDDDQDALMKGLNMLKEALQDAKHLSQLEPGVFLAPFLEIIRSEETTGTVTSLALTTVNKIICYGLLDASHPAIAQCVEAVANAVAHTRFVGTDSSGEGVVLMKMLQVLRELVLSPAGDYLSNESICEIMLCCFRICYQTRLSELLKRTAEHCLKDMVQHLFTRLPRFDDDTGVLLNMKKMRTNTMENTRSKNRRNKNHYKEKAKTNPDDPDESETHLLSPVDRVKVGHLATTPVTPAGNIVDMQGQLDHGTPDKAEDEKPDKEGAKKDHSDKEESGKREDNTDGKGQEESEPKEVSETDKDTTFVREENLSTEKEEKSGEQTEEEEQEKKETDCPKQESQEVHSADEEKSIDLQSPVGSVEDLSIDGGLPKASKAKEPEQMEEYVNTQGVRFTPLQQHAPYGSLCIREVFRYLVLICSPLDKQNNEMTMHLGLSLLQVALEIAADALSKFPSLLELVKDDLCRNLILLLGTDRLSILAADLQVSFLLFESQREHLKFQMEHYITRLMEIVTSESNRVSYEHHELALEAIARLWRIPGYPAELYLNYDCGLYSTNLYEELMKLLSEIASDLHDDMHSMQYISLDAIFTLISGIEMRCKGLKEFCKPSRHSASFELPTREELLAIKANKRWLILGTEKFNESPREGIAKLTEHGLLGGSPGSPDPERVAKLLRENPGLDKKAIGEYISKKENKNILNCFVRNFDLRNTRIDQALRLYLESFRLPGEAPLISLLLEKFAEHWHDSNGRPFASADAAFTLAYAVIMLNVDQHNYNVKRQNNPMTADEFKRNLKKVNGGADFDQDMLDEIYTSIKGEEIIMPAEQTGLVKENYLWKVLLRRGASPESVYLKVGNSGEFVDRELAEQAWAPIVSALCRAYDKPSDRHFPRRTVAETFLSCASISAHYGMSSDLDTLVVSLCKFTGLATGGEPEQVVLHLGGSGKCQLATRTLFKITHSHGSALRSSWKNIVDCLQSLHKARLLPKDLTEGEDFISPTGKVTLIRDPTTPKSPPVDQGIFSSLYFYIASDASRLPPQAKATAKKRAQEFIGKCYLKQIVEESKFLQVESLRSLVGALVSANPHDEDISVFLLELLLEVTIQNRDRVMCVWSIVQAHMDGLLTTSARENHPYVLERVTVGMLRLAIRLLRGEEFASTVLPPLLPLTHLPSATSAPLARQIAYGLFELLKTGAANIHTTEDWRVVFSLLECAGAGAIAPKQSNTVLDEAANARSVLDPRPISPVPEWVLVSPTGTEAPLPVAADTIVLDRDLQPHDPAALVKCCESLTFLVRDVAHVTPFNFELCVRCVRTFAEAVLQCPGKRSRVHNVAEEVVNYHQSPIQLLDLMHTLHTRTAQVFRWWAEEGNATEGVSLWPQAWRPLLQGIARLCCDSRRPVRTAAITCLQSTLLAHDLAQLSAVEWSQCLEQVLFPLLAQLLGPIGSNDPIGVEETRVRAAMLLSKVFLHHLNPLLTLPGFLPLWLTVLDLLRAYMHADNSELLFEAIPESLKNMLLVMSSANVLAPSSNLWAPTWRTIDGFLPNLKAELFPEPPPTTTQAQSAPQVISLVEQQQPSFPGAIAPQPGSIAPQPGSMATQSGSMANQSGSIAPQAGSMAPQSGPMANQPGSMAPQPGSMAPQSGSMAPQSGSMANQPGSIMAPQSGSMAPQPGSMAPQSGSMAPQAGSMAPQSGSMAPQPGSMALQPGIVSPQPGSMAPQPGIVSPQPGSMVQQSGIVSPQSGSQAPQTGLVSPQHGSMAPQTGLVSPQPGSMTPQTGLVSPQPGSMTPQPGLVSPQHGSMAPQSGLVPPKPGSQAPQSGIVSPKTGVASPQPGPMAPQPGVSSPQPGSTTPRSGLVSPKHGSVSPQSGVILPQPVAPQPGLIYPQHQPGPISNESTVQGQPAAQNQHSPGSMAQNEPPGALPVAPQPLVASQVERFSPVPEVDHQRTEPDTERRPLLMADATSSLGPMTMSTLPFDPKEGQQVITLVNQPPPSVSSPVAVQPTAQQIFDICHTATSVHQVVDPTEYWQRSSRTEENDRLLPKIVQNEDQIAMAKYEEWKQLQLQLQLQLQQQQQHQPGSLQSGAQHLPYKQELQQRLVTEQNAPSPSETTTVDTAAATMFNSAAYFSEDPAADRLFVVTNP